MLINLFSNTLSYFIFLLFIFITCLLFKNKKIVNIIIILCFVVFAGIKVPFSIDLQHYASYFETNDYFFYIEPSFFFFRDVGKILFNNYVILFVLYQLFTILFVIKALRLFSGNNNFIFCFGIFLYIFIPFLFLSSFGVQLRQLLALSLVLLSTYYLMINKYKLYILFSIFAFLSHYSSIFATLLIYFIIKHFNNKKKLLILLIINILTFILIFIEPTFIFNQLKEILNTLISNTKYINYFKGIDQINYKKVLFYNLLSLWFLLVAYKNKNDYVLDKIISIFVIGVILLNIFSPFNSATRIVYYFLIFQIIIIPRIIFLFKQQAMVFFSVILLFIIQFIYGLNYVSPLGYKIFLPYKGFDTYIFDLSYKETK